ncbi:hypothetical protein Y032_0146g2524 [Ancylostoma ceylanicum]|uniref:Uncharacterized protein n=2 Tax=Ancylostoma ceylanicum TaxID=53326 RepID=A0A016T256_9BILA|nr:hypothetical protein Y032_0146g2524 [Ancylostoma ceylanicum]
MRIEIAESEPIWTKLCMQVYLGPLEVIGYFWQLLISLSIISMLLIFRYFCPETGKNMPTWFMCGLIPSVLQIEDGESLKNKTKLISPEETERYVLIAVMRQSKEEFDSLSRREMEELEEVLRNSEMEKKRLEEERTREQELVSNALAISEEITGKSTEISGATSSSPGTNSEDPKQTVPSRATASNERNLRSLSKQGRENSASGEEIRSASTIRKQQRPNNEETQSANMPNSVGKDLKETTGSKLSSVEAPPENQQPIERPSSKRKDGLPPASKRTGSQSGERRQSKSTSSKEKRPSTEGRKRAEEADVGKKANIAEDDLGIVHGPREKNLYDVNALLQEPSRLNSATVRSREEYLRIRRDRLLAMKASEREKQMNEVSQRAAQERPRTAKAARGLMRGSRVAIETDEVLAARRAILEKLRTEIDGTTDS